MISSIRDLKIELLKQEIELNNQKVNHFDNLRYHMKQMAITLWLAAIGVAITQELRIILWLSAFIPLPFWLFESYYHGYQECFSARLVAILKFIQTGKYEVPNETEAVLEDCLKDPKFGSFPVPDYYGEKTLSKQDRRKMISVFRNMFKVKMMLFYLPLIFVALFLINVICKQ